MAFALSKENPRIIAMLDDANNHWDEMTPYQAWWTYKRSQPYVLNPCEVSALGAKNNARIMLLDEQGRKTELGNFCRQPTSTGKLV